MIWQTWVIPKIIVRQIPKDIIYYLHCQVEVFQRELSQDNTIMENTFYYVAPDGLCHKNHDDGGVDPNNPVVLTKTKVLIPTPHLHQNPFQHIHWVQILQVLPREVISQFCFRPKCRKWNNNSVYNRCCWGIGYFQSLTVILQ